MAPDIQTDIRWDHSLLDEAAAIVEAEWIRLRQDEGPWEPELANLLAEGSAPRPRPGYLGTLSGMQDWDVYLREAAELRARTPGRRPAPTIAIQAAPACH